jgi:predicted DNA-binding transcriptional regulator YafY
MPSADHFTTYSRQWELLKLLPSRQPGKTARQLHEQLGTAGHEVGKRTVERDLSELSRIFPIASNEISIPYGWYWKPGARVDFPGIDLAEAVSLGLMEDILRQLIPQNLVQALEGRFAAASDKLKALPKNRLAKWADLVRYLPPGLPLLKPAIDPEVSRAVQEALLQRQQLKVTYRGPGSDPKELVLHPLGFIQLGERSYLLATTFNYPNVVYYALHRMQTAEILDEPAKRPADFSLDDYLARSGGQFGDGKMITLKANLTDNLAGILRETPLSLDQKITTRAGKINLTATVKDSWQLHFWIQSQGPFITVLQPSALRKFLIASLQSTLTNYSAG